MKVSAESAGVQSRAMCSLSLCLPDSHSGRLAHLMVVLAHLQQGVVATFRGQVGTTIVDHSVKVGASHPPSPLLPLTLTDIAPTDLTAAAALVRKAYSKRRRLRLWSKPVNLRGRDDSCQAPL